MEMMLNKLLFDIKTATLVPNKTQASGLKGQEDDYGRNAGQCGHAALLRDALFQCGKADRGLCAGRYGRCGGNDIGRTGTLHSTSEATVTRFCKKLGFENYRAFQLALARDVMERQPLEISNEVQLDNIPQSLQNILSNKIDEMSATINGINPENLQRVLELLQNAQLVQIAAVGNTIPVAMDAAFKFNQLGMRCITSEISEKNSAFALTLTPQDVLLLISNSGKSRRLNQMAQTARDNGVPVVLITCDRSSPLAQLADHLLISTNREQLITTTDFALSRISAIVIIEVLYNFLLVGRPGAKGFVSRHEGLMAHDKDVL